MEMQYAIGQEVEIIVSGEQGTVIGRAQYQDCADSYYIRYSGADGRAVENWWAESAIRPLEA